MRQDGDNSFAGAIDAAYHKHAFEYMEDNLERFWAKQALGVVESYSCMSQKKAAAKAEARSIWCFLDTSGAKNATHHSGYSASRDDYHLFFLIVLTWL